VSSSTKTPIFALVGHPNTGKTTLFNALTGLRQKVGNYAGVTVEKKEGIFFSQHGKPLKIIDLPGTYSLTPRSPDEAITRDILLGIHPKTPPVDGILAVVNPNNLSRQLHFILQLLELGTPMILIVNCLSANDDCESVFDIQKLEQQLKIPVVILNAHQPKTLIKLRLLLSRPLQSIASGLPAECAPILPTITAVSHTLLAKYPFSAQKTTLLSFLSLSNLSSYEILPMDCEWQKMVRKEKEWLNTAHPNWLENIFTARQKKAQALYTETLKDTLFQFPSATRITEAIDSVVLHPIFGGVLLIAILCSLFYLIFFIAEFPKQWLEMGIETLTETVRHNMPPGIFNDLLTNGILTGAGSVLAFLPQILLLFFGIGILESTGYLARAAFILDRPMQRVGLQGKSFIPFLSSYACAIPGIMATRMIDAPADRLATILVAPWASCSARLPVYLMLIGLLSPAFENSPSLKALALFGLYALGTFSAFAAAWLIRKTIVKGDALPMIMELPHYQWPNMRYVWLEMWHRGKLFVFKAGTLIVALSILIWYALSHPIIPGSSEPEQLLGSFGGQLGQFLEPLLRPLGFDWPIAVALVTSFAAREVFVSTMAILYASHDSAWMSPLTALSLLVFYVYAMQCMSTLAIVKRETTSWRWPLFQLAFMTTTAYGASFMVFQIGRLMGFV
jgi:ferrous iron transport protein B